MAYAAVLLFDAATEAALRRLGVGEAVNARPYITLGICRDLRDAAALKRVLENLAGEQTGPLPVTLSSLGIFPGDEGVLFYGVTVTTALLLLHRRFHALFTPQAVDWSSFYEPGQWVPHCVLAHSAPPDQLPERIAALQKQISSPLSGLLTGIALVETPSGDVQGVFPFANRVE